jgi:hypothetical protein
MSFHNASVAQPPTDRYCNQKLMAIFANDVDTAGVLLDEAKECIDSGPGGKVATVTYLKALGKAQIVVDRLMAAAAFYNANLPKDEKGNDLPTKTAPLVQADID